MVAIKVGENLWGQFVSVAKKKQKKPERLAEMILREYLAQAADEELLARTEKAARRKGASIAKVEAEIKELRRKPRQ